MTETLRETTVWKSSTIRNGIYLMSGGKCLAFCNYKGETTYLTKPMQIDKRGRQFEKMVKSPFKVLKDDARDPNLIEVRGSKGETYQVNPVEKTCSCAGFQFRGKCRHLEMVK